VGQAAIFVGTTPADPQPDQDGDLVLDYCDNCPAVANPTQKISTAMARETPATTARRWATRPRSTTTPCPQATPVSARREYECTANLADVAMMRRYLAGKTNPASFSQARCVLTSAPFPCDPLAVVQVRKTLVGASPPLVQNCP